MKSDLGNCKTCNAKLHTVCKGYYKKFNYRTKQLEKTKEWDNGHPGQCCDCFDESMGKPKDIQSSKSCEFRWYRKL